MIAARAGLFIAKHADCSATTPYRTQVRSQCRTACRANTIDSSHRPAEEARASVRRSTASAIAPPYSPNTASGTSAQRPTSPTEKVDPVSAYTWIDTVTAVIC